MWGPGASGGFQNALQMGLQMGAMAREQQQQNALMKQRDEALALQAQGLAQQQQAAQAAAEAKAASERRNQLPMMTKLLETAVDEPSYQRNLQIAQQYGLDTTGLPQNFDPVWRDQNLQTMKLLQTPQGQEALSNAGKIAADMGLQPGTPEFNEQVRRIFTAEQNKTLAAQPGGTILQTNPFTGETQVLAGPDATSGVPAPGAVEDGYRFKGGDPSNPDSWEPVGGAGSNASGSFRG